MNFGYIFEQNSVVLVVVFLLLGSMSVTSWYLIFRKALNLRQEKLWLASFKSHLTSPDWPLQNSQRRADGSASLLIAEVEKLKPVLSTYNQQDRKEILSMHLVQTLDQLRAGFDHGLTILASVGSSAPFIGLFGTVWGIYGALTKIAAEGNANLNAVAGPMGEALIATAVGLFAAIPAVLAYNAFVRENRLLVQDLRHIAEQLATYLSFGPAMAHTAETVKLVRN